MDPAYLGGMVATHMVREVSPIPPGRYWITITGGGNIRDFDAWIRDMRGAVRVEASSLDQDAPRPVEFVIFNVPQGRMPFLNDAQFGFPNTAPPGVTSLQDVEQSPIVPGPLERVQAFGDAAVSDAKMAFLLLLLVLALKPR